MPVSLLVPAFAPASLVCDGMKRLSFLLPNGTLNYIPRSKLNWTLRADAPLHVEREISALLHRITSMVSPPS